MRPVGAVAETPVNVRIVSATHKDLARRSAGRALPPGPVLPAQRDPASACRRCASASTTWPPICAARAASASPRDAGVVAGAALTPRRACSTCCATASRATCASSRTCCTARVALWPAASDRRARPGPARGAAAATGRTDRSERRASADVAAPRCGAAGRARPTLRCPATWQALPRRGRARHPRARARAPPLQPHRGRRQPGAVAAPDALPHGAAGRRHCRRPATRRPG